MKRSLSLIAFTGLFFLFCPTLRAQDMNSGKVAHIASQKKANRVEKAIHNLQKRIQDGIDRKIIDSASSQNLQKQVQDIADLKDRDFKDNGAHVLTRGQLKTLRDMVGKANKAVRQAEHSPKGSM